MKVKIALLITDTPAKEVVDKHGDYNQIFNDLFRNSSKGTNYEVECHPFDVINFHYPKLEDNYFDAYLITGSGISLTIL
jgi:hypothetical protein